MKNLITVCVRRPVTIIMLMFSVFFGAIYSIRLLPLDKLPEITLPKITVETVWPGMGAAELRTAVTIPLEDSLSAVKGLEGIRSVSRDGSSLLLLSFRWGSSPVRAAALVREAIDTVYPGLPFGVSKPVLLSGDSQEEAHAIIAIRSLTGDNSFARNLAEYELRSRLRRIAGVGRVSVSGGERQEIRIRADPARLAARSLDSGELARMISRETGDFPAGSAREGNREITVISSGRPRFEDEIPLLVINAGDAPLRIGDLAGTSREPSPRQSLFIFNGIEQTAVEIFRQSGADPVSLSKDIAKVIEECNAMFSEHAEITLVYDSSPSIVRFLSDLGVSAFFAALAVILLLTVFLGRISCSILAVISLPFSASVALIALAMAGRSLNSMSLAGLALGIGLVSDTSVIVLDLFCRKYNRNREVPSFDEAGSLAASVSLSSLAGTLTTIIVFLPIIFLPGTLGALFGDLALTLIVSVAGGWFYAQLCLPSLFRLFAVNGFFPSNINRKNLAGRHGFHPVLIIEKCYGVLLRKVMRRPLPAIAISVLVSIAGMVLLRMLPMEFIAPETVSEVYVALDFPPGTSPDGAVSRSIDVSVTLLDVSGISFMYAMMGAEAEDSCRRVDPAYRRERLLFRCFLGDGIDAGWVMENIRTVLGDHFSKEKSSGSKNILGGNSSGGVSPLVSIELPVDRTTTILGLSSALTVAVKTNTQEESSSHAEELFRLFESRVGNGGNNSSLKSIKIRPSGTRPQLSLVPRREFCASLGISVSDIAAAVYSASEGIISGTMEIEGRPLDIRVSGRLPENDPEWLKTLPLSVSSLSQRQNQAAILLGSIADIEWMEAKTTLIRQDRSDVVYVDLFPAAGEEKQIRSMIAEICGTASDENHAVSLAEESAFSRYRSALAVAVVLVLILLYLVLGAQFESFLLPLILLLSVPFSLAGAGPALFLSSSSLDSGSILGLIALFGISVNNGIVLFETGEEKTRSGLSPARAVYSGALERFRPVLLTTLTTILALLPLVISPLGNSQRGMASAMLGGIVVSGLIAFFVFPPIFIRFLKSKNRSTL